MKRVRLLSADHYCSGNFFAEDVSVIKTENYRLKWIWRVHNALESLGKKKKTFPHPASDFDASSEKFNSCISLSHSFLLLNNTMLYKLFIEHHVRLWQQVWSMISLSIQWRFILIALRRWENIIENIKSMLDEIYRIFNQSIVSDINEMWIIKNWIFQNMHRNLMSGAEKFFSFCQEIPVHCAHAKCVPLEFTWMKVV